MASEYLKWKYRDVKPDPPPAPLTGKEKLKNWFAYHKWHLLVGAVLLWVLGSILYHALGIGQIRPDYTFAYVGREALPEDCVSALETGLAALGEDVNGDGRTVVELRQYVTQRSGDAETALYYNYAADTVLLADIMAGDSYYFLMDDPQGVQRAYQILADADGGAPEDSDYSAEDRALRWNDCPALRSLGLDPEITDGLYLGRRYFLAEKQPEALGAFDAFWHMLTKGAAR